MSTSPRVSYDEQLDNAFTRLVVVIKSLFVRKNMNDEWDSDISKQNVEIYLFCLKFL